MTQSPIQQIEAHRIGTVDFVSPDEIKVLLDIEAPDSMALNSGTPQAFPRVHSYVLIAVEVGFMVGQVEWLTVERSAFPKRRGLKDFGLIDLPYPLRRMSVNPLGTLRVDRGDGQRIRFRRGTESLPTVGSGVLLPTEEQLRAVVESAERRRVQIGTSRLSAHAKISIDPDRIFGRHLAVLGNTGSGKSCSVAGLIRWCVTEAAAQSGRKPNARFVVLDPNGEYSRAFAESSGSPLARVFRVEPQDGNNPLRVPLWFWNSDEWASFLQASSRTQRPLLKRALREVRSGRELGADEEADERRLKLRRYLSSTAATLRTSIRSGAIRSESNKFGFTLKVVWQDLTEKAPSHADIDLTTIVGAAKTALQGSISQWVPKGKTETVTNYRPFPEAAIQPVLEAVEAALGSLGGLLTPDAPDENVPLPFKGADLADHLQILAERENVSQYVEFLVSRMRSFLSEPKIQSILEQDDGSTLLEWLKTYLDGESEGSPPVTVIDLSLVPSEVAHVITAVITRVMFEALQRYRKEYGAPLPTVLVMEEAHTFVKRYRDDTENPDAAKVCCQVFERVAREGRKFGLGLVLSSQRPSELSPTVLSQCNTFLLHRISNDRDQELVQRLVPDNLRGVLRELPSLPSQSAILMGWATELPLLVRMRDLPPAHQPHSEDPDFWNVWTGQDSSGAAVERKAAWEPIVADWQRWAESTPGAEEGSANQSPTESGSDDEGATAEPESG